MDTAHIEDGNNNIDYVAIDRHARQLRAEAVRAFFKSVKETFAGLGGYSQASNRPTVNYGTVKGTGAFL